MLKKPKNLDKWMYSFIWYTIITFIAGLVLKIILTGRLIDQTHNINAAEDDFSKMLNVWKTSGTRPKQLDHNNMFVHIKTLEQASDQLNVFSRQHKEVRLMMILQVLIIILTIFVYARSLKDLRKIWKDKEHKLTFKMYKVFKIEYIIFLSIFLFIDAFATYLLFKESPKMSGWTIYSIISLIIPAFLASGSLMLLRKNKILIAK